MSWWRVVSLFFISFSTFANTQDFNHFQWNRNNLLNPLGIENHRDWYEWWYYKVTIPETEQAFYFIYGVVNPWDREQTQPSSRSYVAFGNFGEHLKFENRFKVEDFKGDYNSPHVRIANNEADGKTLRGKILDDDGREVAFWDLQMKCDWSFNAMGWGLFVPSISNIFWFPAQASASMSGEIRYKEKIFHLKDAPAYQDRNWGSSFPKWWAWIVSNSFKDFPDSALAAGGGLPGVFEHLFVKSGMTIGLKHLGKEYKFRTTDADIIDFNIHYGKWEIEARNKRQQKILISAKAAPEKFLVIPFQTPNGNLFYDYEALKADVNVQLYRKENFRGDWVKVANLQSSEGGLEYGSPDLQTSIQTAKIAYHFGYLGP